MTENEKIIEEANEIAKGRMYATNEVIRLQKELEQYRAIGTVEEIQSMKDNGAFSGMELAQIASMQIKLKEYQSIGTIEEFKALKTENAELHNEAQAERALLDKRDAEVRAKAIDEAIVASAKAICVGCGYLDGYKCTYKGSNCGVSKPMLESVTKALEQLKGGAV